MTIPSELKEIDGAQELYDWFGYWPDFHDAEVVRLDLNRSSVSTVAIYTWEITGQVDDNGYYVLAKHVLVEFVLEKVTDLTIGGFSHQNVISGLDIERATEGYLLTLAPCHGLAGTIEAKKLSIRLHPGRVKENFDNPLNPR